MAAVGKSKEADAARCRRHPSHRHSAGVCPFCLCDRLSRVASAATASGASSSSASSPCSSAEEEGVASTAQAPPCRTARRVRLGQLMRQEEAEKQTAACRREEAPAAVEVKKAKRNYNFWARLQQLHPGGWHRKDGCSMAHSTAVGEKSAAPKRAPLF